MTCHEAYFESYEYGYYDVIDLDPFGSSAPHLHAALRALKPGGQLVILEFFRPTAWTTRAFHAVYNRTVLPVVGWACTGNLDAYLYLPRSIGAMKTAVDYRRLLEDVGFEQVEIEALTLGVASIVRARKPAGGQ